MIRLDVAVLALDEDQRALLQMVAESTGVATVLHSFRSFPTGTTDMVFRRIQEKQPDIVIIDIPAATPALALQAIQLLRSSNPSVEVFAIGDMNAPQVIVNAMRSGACEYLERPVSANQLMEAFARFAAGKKKEAANGSRGKVYTFFNAKGGCGATTLAVNTALAIMRAHGRTALVDLAPLGNVALQLDLKPNFTVTEAVRNLHRLDAALLESYMSRTEGGLHVLAGTTDPLFNDFALSDIPSLFDVLVKHYRYVVVDLSTRRDNVTRTVCELSEKAVLVAHSDVASLYGAAQFEQSLFGQLGRDRFKLVLNRYRKISGFTDKDIETATRNHILWKVPNNYAAFSGSVDRGVPVVAQNHSELAKSFNEFIKALVGSASTDNSKAWFRSVKG